MTNDAQPQAATVLRRLLNRAFPTTATVSGANGPGAHDMDVRRMAERIAR
jgi:hypothetical protein